MMQRLQPGCGGGGAGIGAQAGKTCCGKRHAGIGRGAVVEPIALAALLTDSAHGYDLRKAILDMTGGEIDVDAGGLYRVLRRLEEEGFAVSEWGDESSGPRRRHYDITDSGRELAQDWVSHLRERERFARLMAGLLEDALSKGAATTEGGAR